jgi:hypothetical protein
VVRLQSSSRPAPDVVANNVNTHIHT